MQYEMGTEKIPANDCNATSALSPQSKHSNQLPKHRFLTRGIIALRLLEAA